MPQLILGEFETFEQWLRATAVAYQQAGDADTADGLFEMAREVAPFDQMMVLGRRLEESAKGPLGAREDWNHYLLKAATGDDEAGEDTYPQFKNIVALFDEEDASGGDAEDPAGAVRRLIVYKHLLARILGIDSCDLADIDEQALTNKADAVRAWVDEAEDIAGQLESVAKDARAAAERVQSLTKDKVS